MQKSIYQQLMDHQVIQDHLKLLNEKERGQVEEFARRLTKSAESMIGEVTSMIGNQNITPEEIEKALADKKNR